MNRRVKKVVRAIRDAWRNRTATTLPNEELGERLVFGQQHVGTQAFFRDLVGQPHTVPLVKLPHYEFLCRHADEEPSDDTLYARYLNASWAYLFPESNTSERRIERMRQFLAVYRDIESRKHLGAHAIRVPVHVCRRPDERFLIISGNHRASAALRLGLDLRVSFVDRLDHLRKITAVPDEFYGSARLQMPYQSIFLGTKELLPGRRPDVYDRIRSMRADDLEGKTVLELGCNIGSNCFIATQHGAVHATGVDYSSKLITAAVRVNAFLAAPADFRVFDLNQAMHDQQAVDTVFCFSVVNHLQSTDGIVQTILRTTGSVLYFEGHADTQLQDYRYLLTGEYFRTITLIGHMRNGIHTSKATRPLWRCEVRR